jgi:hypothetical protein
MSRPPSVLTNAAAVPVFSVKGATASSSSDCSRSKSSVDSTRMPYLAAAIRQLEAINAGAPIAKPLTREQAINIVTEQIGLFESVLRRYGGRKNVDRT